MCHTRIKPSALQYIFYIVHCTQVTSIALRFTFCALHGLWGPRLVALQCRKLRQLHFERRHFSTISTRFQLFSLNLLSSLKHFSLEHFFSGARQKWLDSTHFHLFFCEAAVKRMEKKWVGDCSGIRGFSANIYCSSPIYNIRKMVLSLYRTILGVYNEAWAPLTIPSCPAILIWVRPMQQIQRPCLCHQNQCQCHSTYRCIFIYIHSQQWYVRRWSCHTNWGGGGGVSWGVVWFSFWAAFTALSQAPAGVRLAPVISRRTTMAG